MRKWFVFGMVFICIYLFFLVKTLPSNVLMNYVPLPKNIIVQGVSGTVWQGEIDHVQINKTHINQVKTELSFISLLMLAPEMLFTFGDAFLSGPEGVATLVVDQNLIQLSNINMTLSANEIAQQLILPLPVIAKGDVSLNIDEIVIQSAGYQCDKASGNIQWLNASLTALDQKINLGNFKAKLSCDKGRLSLTIDPKNNLGLVFTGYFKKNGKIAGTGYLKPSAKFPNKLKSVLPFLGRKDNQGRYRLTI